MQHIEHRLVFHGREGARRRATWLRAQHHRLLVSVVRG
jgi:hypothetical protein